MQNSESKECRSNKPNLLIGVTGSVATIKLKELVHSISSFMNIRIVVTQSAKSFLKEGQGDIQQFKELIYEDKMQWEMWNKRGDPVLHIELKKWAHCLLIAPLSANTLAKLSNGLSDNLLTLICRAWPMKKSQSKTLECPIVVCPSMNVGMWEHPITAKQLDILIQWGYEILGPVEKKMMCGDFGKGAMIEVKDIITFLQDKLTLGWFKQEGKANFEQIIL